MHLVRRKFIKQLITLSGGLLAACSPAATTPTQTQAAETAPVSETGVAATPTQSNDEVRVLASGLDFPEGPAFDPQGGLWCTELQGGNLVKWQDGKLERIQIGGAPGGRGNGLVFDEQGRAWVADSGRNAILRYDPASGEWETVLDAIDGKPLQSPNDLIFDAQGNLLFTCPNFASEDPIGYVACLTPKGEVFRLGEGFNRPNGIDLVGDGKYLVVADTYRKILIIGNWNLERLAWEDPHTWAFVGGSEGPDGMAPGADGLLYQAIYGDGVIRVVDGQGEVVREIRVPGANPTNVAIDPSGKLGLVVTETEHGQLLSFPGIQPGAVAARGGRVAGN